MGMVMPDQYAPVYCLLPYVDSSLDASSKIGKTKKVASLVSFINKKVVRTLPKESSYCQWINGSCHSFPIYVRMSFFLPIL